MNRSSEALKVGAEQPTRSQRHQEANSLRTPLLTNDRSTLQTQCQHPKEFLMEYQHIFDFRANTASQNSNLAQFEKSYEKRERRKAAEELAN